MTGFGQQNHITLVATRKYMHKVLQTYDTLDFQTGLRNRIPQKVWELLCQDKCVCGTQYREAMGGSRSLQLLR